MTRILMAEEAKTRSFEDIYAEIAEKKIQLDVVNKDIKDLERKASKLRSEINHQNQIALTKRRAMVNKK